MTSKAQPKHYAHFEIDIIAALASQLTGALDALDVGPLEPSTLSTIPKLQGVYKLFHDDQLVYVGKADNLPGRLAEHRKKISGRHNISVDSMSFKCLSVHQNWTALAPEASLIAHYKAQAAGQCEWNGNGFGPHDPGRNREITNKPPDGFDARYPIRTDWVCDWIEPGDWNLLNLLVALKDAERLPYLLRYEREQIGPNKFVHFKQGHPDHRDKTVTVPRNNMTAEELLVLITKALPGWQATAFPSHLILYKESRDYTHGRVLHREPA